MLKDLLVEIGRSLRSSEGGSSKAKLHLGCGTNILPDWINVDLNGSSEVVRWDLRQPLPLSSDSMDFVFNEHFIEHITREEALSLLRECNRVLKRHGVLRISTPDLRKLVGEYMVELGYELSLKPQNGNHSLAGIRKRTIYSAYYECKQWAKVHTPLSRLMIEYSAIQIDK